MFQNFKIDKTDKINGFIRINDRTKYLTLFGSEKYDAVYNRIRRLISLKSGITYIFSHYLRKSKLIQLSNNHKTIFYSITIVKFGKTEIAKENFYAAKNPIKIWDVNVNNIVISKLVKTKTNSKYLVGI